MKTCPSCHASYHDALTFCPRDGESLRALTGLEPGLIIRNKYEVVQEIARGGMGVVYRARHLLWGEDKAIKLLLDTGQNPAQFARAIQAEAKVMRQLNHPNIVRVEDIDYTEDDQLFVVMELVEGESLRQRLTRGGAMPYAEALRLAAQACDALAAAHQRGIIHRDIKPQNILLAKGDDGEVLKLIDFGISKVRGEAGLGFTGVITGTTGMFVGTPEYASPEQAVGQSGSELDGRTDLYSLGVVLFEMLTGRVPFVANTPMAMLMQRVIAGPVAIRDVRSDIPEAVGDVVMKSIAKEKEARYGSAEEMKAAIAAALEKRKPAAVPVAPEAEKPAAAGSDYEVVVGPDCPRDIPVIKLLRGIKNWTLLEAMGFIEQTDRGPVVLAKLGNRHRADVLAARLKQSGAPVEVRAAEPVKPAELYEVLLVYVGPAPGFWKQMSGVWSAVDLVQEYANLGPGAAHELLARTRESPQLLMQAVTKEAAEHAAKRFEAAGAIVEIRPRGVTSV